MATATQTETSIGITQETATKHITRALSFARDHDTQTLVNRASQLERSSWGELSEHADEALDIILALNIKKLGVDYRKFPKDVFLELLQRTKGAALEH